MTNNIIFIGGIHGVGKSTLCKKICDELEIGHLSASKLLGWNNNSVDDKKVDDVESNQNKLLYNLNKILSDKGDKYYIFDGHYCLIGSDKEYQKIPKNTFEEINPVALLVITENPKTINERFQSRGHTDYDIPFIDKMQQYEIEYAIELGKSLGLNVYENNCSNYDNIITTIKDYLKV